VIIQKEHNEALARHERRTTSGKLLPPIQGIQVTTDPHNGFSYMGLERNPSLDRASCSSDNITFDGFPDALIEELANAGEIISTERLAASGLFQKAFLEVEAIFGEFAPDWVNTKATTAAKFWQRIEYLVERQQGFMENIEAEVIRLYPQLGELQSAGLSENMRQLELRHRAMLMLTNAYSGHLENSDGYYSFSEHKGDIVAVLEHTSGPYNLQAYVVSKEDEDIGKSVALSCTLVAKDRREGRTTNTSGVQMGPERFEQAPVPVFVKIETKGELSAQDKLFLLQYVPGKGDRRNFKELDNLGLSDNLLSAVAELEELVARIYAQQAENLDYLREQKLLNVHDNKICIIPLLIDRTNKPLQIIREGIPHTAE